MNNESQTQFSQFRSQIGPFVFPQNTHCQADNGPQVKGMEISAVVFF